MIGTRYMAALGVALLAAAALAPTAGGGGAARAADTGVDATNSLTFSPASVTIAVGDTVTWTVVGAAPHTVTEDGGAFASPGSFLTTGQTYQFTFSAPGTYHYHCAIHGSVMAGTVVVEAAATATNTPAATATAAPTRTRTPTETPTDEATAAAATSTPAAAMAAATATPPVLGGAVEVTPTTAAGGAAAGASLPRAGSGAVRGGGARWPSAVLALAGVAALAAATALRRRRG